MSCIDRLVRVWQGFYATIGETKVDDTSNKNLRFGKKVLS